MVFKPRTDPFFCGFHTEDHRFQVPPAFMNHQAFPETTVTIRTRGRERSWDVRMEVGFCLTDGWSELVKDLDLQLGDFLFFRLVGYFTLEIEPFCGHTHCSKPLNLK